MIPLIILVALWLTAPPSDDWIRIAVAVSGGCSIGILAGAWGAVQFGKKVWLSIAEEWSRTKEFCDAVNACRKQAEWDFIEKMRLMMKEHEDEEWPHGVWRHDHYNEDHARHELRLVTLEQRGGRRETDNP